MCYNFGFMGFVSAYEAAKLGWTHIASAVNRLASIHCHIPTGDDGVLGRGLERRVSFDRLHVHWCLGMA